jgi:hypothetical protein
MEIKGKVIVVQPIEKGHSNGKDWEKQNIVIEEIEGQYPKKIALQGFGKIVDTTKNLKVGQVITAHINIESREYNSKWYTNVGVWKIDFEGVTNQSNEQVGQAQSTDNQSNTDDLPFN